MIAEKIFAEGVARDIKDYFPPEYRDVECRVFECQKNNGVTKVGINFNRPGKRIGLLVYIEPYYEAAQQGTPMEKIMGEIAKAAGEVMENAVFPDFFNLKEYDKAKEYLSLRLINTKANQRILAGMPHREIEDLSVVYVLQLPLPETEGYGKVKVSNELMKQWNVSEEELYCTAIENMQEKERPVLKSMEAIIMEVTTGQESEENLLNKKEDFRGSSMGLFYVLTNEEKAEGARVMVHPDIMGKISELFPEGYYILPSSIHEVLILPKNEMTDPREIGKMVREVNRQEVVREEILSDRIYEYDREKGRISQVPESIEKRRAVER